jgi:predicted transcriptional regulator
MVRRSRLEVFLDIIKTAARSEIRRTHIMHRANLSWIVLKDALRTLEEKGILKSEIRGKEIYISLTHEGYRVLERFNEIERAFSNDSLGVQPQLPIKSPIGS